MSESKIRIPQEGDGPYLRTMKRTKNGDEVHEEYMHLVDKDGNLLGVSLQPNFLGRSDKEEAFNIPESEITGVADAGWADILYIKNPVASGINLYLVDLLSYLAGNSGPFIIEVYYDPTTTADGTGLDEVLLNLGGSATAVITAFKGPTLTANGTLIHRRRYPANQIAIITCKELPIVLQEDHEMFVRVQNNAGSAKDVYSGLAWIERPSYN